LECKFNIFKSKRNDDFFSKLVVDAVTSVKEVNDGVTKYPIKGITILKKQGQSAKQSAVYPGFALNSTRCSQSNFSFF
jgi:chaperonin GroEL (HSP60 family)